MASNWALLPRLGRCGMKPSGEPARTGAWIQLKCDLQTVCGGLSRLVCLSLRWGSPGGWRWMKDLCLGISVTADSPRHHGEHPSPTTRRELGAGVLMYLSWIWAGMSGFFSYRLHYILLKWAQMDVHCMLYMGLVVWLRMIHVLVK